MLTLAAVVVGVHLASVHLQPELSGDRPYNNANPGLYVRTAEDWQGGAYYNSHRRASFYAGRAWETSGTVRAGLGVFAATGYPMGSVVPMVTGSLATDVGATTVRLSATPRIGDKASAVVHLSLEWKLP